MGSFGIPDKVLKRLVWSENKEGGWAHVEILEEVHNERVWDNQRNEDECHVTSKQKTTLQCITKLPPFVGFQHQVPKLPLLIKQKIENTELKRPLHGLREDLLLANERDVECQIEDILVEHGDQVVLLPHQSVCDVVRIESLL